MQDGFTLQDGEELTSSILRKLGFIEHEFKLKPVTSNYYAPGTDTEVVVKCEGEEVEVANLGFYSGESLANYGIRHPVFNVGFGVERIAMLLEGVHDIRALVYPQFCPEVILMDEEIAKRIGAYREPQTEKGKQLVEVLVRCATQNKDRIGPVDVLVFDGELLSKRVKIWIYNWDTGKRMLSYASFNEVYVHNGSIIALPQRKEDLKIPPHFLEIYEEGINTHLKLIDLLSREFVAELEEGIARGDGCINLKFKRANRPKEVNLKIPDHIYRYITEHQKKIQVGGPLFFGIKAEIIKEESDATQ
jgi:O-phosphoseryl-tRNA synthetase